MNYRRNGFISYFIVAIIAGIIGGIISAYIAPNYLYGKIIPMPDLFERREYSSSVSEVIINPAEEVSNVSAVARKAIGSVVGITTVQVRKQLFWEREFEGIGSGFIVDENGYILTNSHVIGDGEAKKISVLLENGDIMEGNVLWFEKALDLAVVKVNGTKMPISELGNSDDLEIGELAVAIGNPLGLDFQRSVTSGVISGLHRSIRVDEYNVIEDLIQTDASINPGNSGGPLLNNKGEVIGINTAKLQSGEGLGFAIPINLVKPIVSEIISKGEFNNIYIGFTGSEVKVYERQQGVNLKANEGVVVVEVLPNSPAEISNIKPLDVIVAVDDYKVESMSGLRKILYRYRIGDKAVLTIIRDGKEIKKDIIFKNF